MLSYGNLQVALKVLLFGLQSSCPCCGFGCCLLPGVSCHPHHGQAAAACGRGLQRAGAGRSRRATSLQATFPGVLVLGINWYL